MTKDKDKDSVIHVCSDVSSPPYLTVQTLSLNSINKKGEEE